MSEREKSREALFCEYIIHTKRHSRLDVAFFAL